MAKKIRRTLARYGIDVEIRVTPPHPIPRKALVLQGLQIADKPSPSAGFLFFNGVMLKTPMP
ncbi:hypothetical protein, partial [Burkholderia pseudomallei]